MDRARVQSGQPSGNGRMASPEAACRAGSFGRAIFTEAALRVPQKALPPCVGTAVAAWAPWSSKAHWTTSPTNSRTNSFAASAFTKSFPSALRDRVRSVQSVRPNPEPISAACSPDELGEMTNSW